eukprot:649009-Prorocentrum_lima.AAC.1
MGRQRIYHKVRGGPSTCSIVTHDIGWRWIDRNQLLLRIDSDVRSYSLPNHNLLHYFFAVVWDGVASLAPQPRILERA